jgi:plastocyanin domain-containing protein
LSCSPQATELDERLRELHQNRKELKHTLEEWALRESTPCGEEVVLPEFGRRARLPENKTVAVEVTPERPGEYEFTCGMNMYKGKLIVRWRRTGRGVVLS